MTPGVLTHEEERFLMGYMEERAKWDDRPLADEVQELFAKVRGGPQ